MNISEPITTEASKDAAVPQHGSQLEIIKEFGNKNQHTVRLPVLPRTSIMEEESEEERVDHRQT